MPIATEIDLAAEYYARVLEAELGPTCVKTDLQYAPLLSQRCANQIWLKREDQQPVFSFKLRGAYNRMVRLQRAGQLLGAIAASAGNHAQGVALAAQQLGVPAVIVMPATTPRIKVDAVARLGAEVVLHGDDFDAALAESRRLTAKLGYAYVHPFDHPDVIAGQGTVAREILDQHPGHIDAILVCIGGGGLAAGMAAYVKHLRPDIKMIGVEPEDAACMKAAMAVGSLVTLPEVSLFADGAAVKCAGAETFDLCRRYLDEVITVSVDEMSNAIKDVFTETRTLIEPAGALAVAGAKKLASERGWRDKIIIATVSGANVSFDRLRHIVERTEVGETHEALLAVRIPERPGSFRQFCYAIGRRNITEFNYRFAQPEHADVFVGIRTDGGEEERRDIIAALSDQGFEASDLTHSDTARLHLRYLVGGRLPQLEGVSERIFRCRFPERPGALLAFLEGMDPTWNISLFHYRNHGAAFGRVLVGMQIPEGDELELQRFLRKLGYPSFEETDNTLINRFLGGLE